MITKELIKDVTISILRRAETTLPKDVKQALARAYEREENEIAKVQLEAMLENVKLCRGAAKTVMSGHGSPAVFCYAW